ncbi:hypothetical protein BDZ91DRAFT_286513 [Kalaharituber pfeilii]|nr:hypothetical protein BDZ91DRAFT_286513 [Kalaharituber pfeilii]
MIASIYNIDCLLTPHLHVFKRTRLERFPFLCTALVFFFISLFSTGFHWRLDYTKFVGALAFCFCFCIAKFLLFTWPHFRLRKSIFVTIPIALVLFRRTISLNLLPVEVITLRFCKMNILGCFFGLALVELFSLLELWCIAGFSP